MNADISTSPSTFGKGLNTMQRSRGSQLHIKTISGNYESERKLYVRE